MIHIPGKEGAIVFPPLHNLMRFVRKYRINYLDLDVQPFTLNCRHEGLDAAMMEEKYGATLVQS